MEKLNRRIGVIALVLTMCFLWGCQQRPASQQKPSEKTYYEFQGVRIGSEFAKVAAVFGEYENKVQEDTTLTTYMYPHFMVTTAQDRGKEILVSILLRSSAVTTEEGAAIGDMREQVIEKHGKNFTEDGEGNLIYTKKDTILSFLIDGEGYVLSITYSAILKQ